MHPARNGPTGYIAPKDMLAGKQWKIHAERDRKLEAARKQRQTRCRWRPTAPAHRGSKMGRSSLLMFIGVTAAVDRDTMPCNMRTLACAVALTLAGSLGSAQDAFVVRDVRVFDGERVIPRASVVVRDGVIRAVELGVVPDSGLPVIDGAGKTLMPGLIDAHTHVFALRDLQQALAFGVTTELDMFGSPDLIAAWKKLDKTKKVDLADVRFAGIGANAPGGRDFDYPVPTIRVPEEAQAFVDARLAEGSDYIKIIQNSGAPSVAPGQTPTPALSHETMVALIEAAHRRGRRAVVHVTFESAAWDALASGADGLAHLFVGSSVRPGFGTLAREHRAFVVPTLSVLVSVCGENPGADLAADARIAPYLLPASNRRLTTPMPMRRGRPRPSCDGLRPAIRQLVDEGVPILAGTDVGNPGIAHGASLHGELTLLVARGLTPTEALTSATAAAADAFGLDDRGRIAPGKQADLLLVAGDPTADVLATRNVIRIWKAGRAFDREAFRANRSGFAKAEVPAGSASGVISSFDDGRLGTNFGTPWRAFGGVTMQLVRGGAKDSRGAMLVSIDPVQPPATWPGIEFAPSGIPGTPADLSARRGLRFWAKGDGRPLRMVMITETGRREHEFQLDSVWRPFEFEFPDAPDFDLSHFLHLIFADTGVPGHREFQIDEIAFY